MGYGMLSYAVEKSKYRWTYALRGNQASVLTWRWGMLDELCTIRMSGPRQNGRYMQELGRLGAQP